MVLLKLRGHVQHFSSTRSKKVLQVFCSEFYPWRHQQKLLQRFDNKQEEDDINKLVQQTIACISLLLDKHDCKDFRPSKRSVWVKSWLEKRAQQGACHNLFQELLSEDAKSFKEFIRMDRLHFQFLVERLYPRLIKRDIVMRKSIKPDEQCCLFLRHIASGELFRSLEYQFPISRRTIFSRIISTVAKAIIPEMQDAYLKTPNTVEEWSLISEKFSQRWNFPKHDRRC